ncbi:hypothetical protein KDL29_11495 [bacterium]|nr:hypothetical protein [bacterium]MCB1221787.1 hypothetical protein [bacterium]UNM09997.1 MAG: hypothetical protein H7A35_08005 [Planctomycetales bacterium]
MPELTNLCLGLMQVEPSGATAGAVKMFVVVGIFLALVITALYFTIKAIRPKTDNSTTMQVREEFNKQKDALLMAAQAKKASREAQESARREGDKDEKEKELLREQVDPQAAVGRSCPLCGLEIMGDSEIIIDPYSGTAYHFSAFLHDWPPDTERPKFVLRWPQDKMVRSEDLLKGF